MANPSRKSISNSISTRDNSACAGVINLGGNLNYMWTNEVPSEKDEGGQMADENVEKRKLILMCRQQVTQSKEGEEAKNRGRHYFRRN